MNFMLNSAGSVTTVKSPEVPEKPLKTHSAASEVRFRYQILQYWLWLLFTLFIVGDRNFLVSF